jgi:hypothetical protein
MLSRVALVRADISEEHVASIIEVKRISKLETMLTVTRNRSTLLQLIVTVNAVPSSLVFVNLMMEAICYSKTSVITRVTRRRILETAFFIVTAVKISNLTQSMVAYS